MFTIYCKNVHIRHEVIAFIGQSMFLPALRAVNEFDIELDFCPSEELLDSLAYEFKNDSLEISR